MKTLLRLGFAAVGLVMFNLSDGAVLGADFTYTTSSSAATITSYTGPGGDVIIPSQLENLPVTTIAHGAFFSRTNVFTLAIPETVTDIAEIVFSGCIALTAFTVVPENPAFSSLEGVLFNKTQTVILKCPQLKAGSYTIPNTVDTIAPYAFAECAGLTSVTLPDTISTLGRDSFYWCTSLAAISIPPRVSNIASWTFAYNRKLASLTILGGVTNIGTYAFYETALRTVALPDTLVSINARAFSSVFSLTNITFGGSLTSIGDSAFEGNGGLTAAYFRGNAPTHGTNLFHFANRVTVYYLPGAGGWESTFAGRPTARWLPLIQSNGPDFGLHAGQLGFNVRWTPGMMVTIEATQSLANPAWSTLSTHQLATDVFLFTDRESVNSPARFYRVRSP
jgi:hypothetical protein